MNNLVSENNPENTIDNEDSFDFRGFFYKVIKDWWVILLSIIVCLAIAYTYLRYKTPIYKIHANVLVKAVLITRQKY